MAWQLLRWLNVSRAILAGLFITLFFTRSLPGELATHAPGLFAWVAIVYFSFSVGVSLAVGKRQPGLISQAILQLGGDICAITLFMYASGGTASGLGELLLVPLVAGALIFSLRLSLGFAALATIAILAQEAFANLAGHSGDYVQTGLLGVIFFAIVALGHALAEQLRQSEQRTAQRDVDLQNMSVLNEYIIQHLRAGILVIDGHDNIRLTNPTAVNTLGVVTTPSGDTPLEIGAPKLKALLDKWRREPLAYRNATLTGPDQTVLMPRFTELGPTPTSGTLVFLEDASAATEQARQMKLASLGHLTASIAHEIRNPLGAINHANELLIESDTLTAEERRLTEIIGDHAQRVNSIIENILKLSRGGAGHAEDLALDQWLRQFTTEFCEQHALTAEDIHLTIRPGRAPLRAHVDTTQLQQVVRNLAENALRYGIPENMARYGEHSLVEFRLGVRPFRNQPYIEVLDQGTGIPAKSIDQIFEPFYTSGTQGSGLGLFIARELCEINNATLTYHPRGNGGSCFRISFANTENWTT